VGLLVRAALALCFRRIERFRADRAPATGPVLFVSNHPGSITDAFIIGTSVPRAVHFVATVRLFKLKPVAALLTRCGVVPVNRRQDNPAAMGTVAETFARCHQVLERGGAIGIFPEGVSYNDEQLRPIKTGAARMALEIEDRYDGALGLWIAPVGLTYSAKDRFRSDVLVHFGEPFVAAEWLARYRADPLAAVRGLSDAIDQRLRALILDLPSLDHQRIVRAVKQLYLDRLRLGNLIVTEPMTPAAEELLLGQAIGQALRHFETHAPDRLAGFVVDLLRYERRLWMLGLADPAASPEAPPPRQVAGLIVGAPVALYGWLHSAVPVRLIDWAVAHFAPRELRRSQAPHISMIAGLVAFGGLYLIAGGVMWALGGALAAIVYLASLPPAALFAHWYLGVASRAAAFLRTRRVLLRVPLARRALARMRAGLIAQLDAFRADYRRDVLGVTAEAAPTPASLIVRSE
jgi:1-acyl-sn-glycerol-3-phosphate acyltransferase